MKRGILSEQGPNKGAREGKHCHRTSSPWLRLGMEQKRKQTPCSSQDKPKMGNGSQDVMVMGGGEEGRGEGREASEMKGLWPVLKGNGWLLFQVSCVLTVEVRKCPGSPNTF